MESVRHFCVFGLQLLPWLSSLVMHASILNSIYIESVFHLRQALETTCQIRYLEDLAKITICNLPEQVPMQASFTYLVLASMVTLQVSAQSMQCHVSFLTLPAAVQSRV